MAGSAGYKFVFLSCVFYGFLGYMMAAGFDEYLSASVPDLASIDSSNFLLVWGTILSNPLSAYGFLSWLSIAILITNVYIIITSVIP